jgi:hypothetical protein
LTFLLGKQDYGLVSMAIETMCLAQMSKSLSIGARASQKARIYYACRTRAYNLSWHPEIVAFQQALGLHETRRKML